MGRWECRWEHRCYVKLGIQVGAQTEVCLGLSLRESCLGGPSGGLGDRRPYLPRMLFGALQISIQERHGKGTQVLGWKQSLWSMTAALTYPSASSRGCTWLYMCHLPLPESSQNTDQEGGNGWQTGRRRRRQHTSPLRGPNHSPCSLLDQEATASCLPGYGGQDEGAGRERGGRNGGKRPIFGEWLMDRTAAHDMTWKLEEVSMMCIFLGEISGPRRGSIGLAGGTK